MRLAVRQEHNVLPELRFGPGFADVCNATKPPALSFQGSGFEILRALLQDIRQGCFTFSLRHVFLDPLYVLEPVDDGIISIVFFDLPNEFSASPFRTPSVGLRERSRLACFVVSVLHAPPSIVLLVLRLLVRLPQGRVQSFRVSTLSQRLDVFFACFPGLCDRFVLHRSARWCEASSCRKCRSEWQNRTRLESTNGPDPLRSTFPIRIFDGRMTGAWGRVGNQATDVKEDRGAQPNTTIRARSGSNHGCLQGNTSNPGPLMPRFKRSRVVAYRSMHGLGAMSIVEAIVRSPRT
eukprot:scaffold741_cov336-Pavlova_lutheri.AAC.54